MGLCAHKLPKPKLHYNLLELGLPFVSSRFDKVVDPRKVHASVYISVPCWHVLVAPHVIGTLHAKLEVSSLTAALNGTLHIRQHSACHQVCQRQDCQQQVCQR